jgi:hypothetical protein
MSGLLDKMGQGGAARVRLYAGVRPSTATLVSVVYLAEPAGTINAQGSLALVPGIESAVLNSTTPTWARVSNGSEEHLFDCDARLSTAADTGQEIVVAAPSGFFAGALLQIQSGVFSALP